MDVLQNPIQHYAWGSHTTIASIQGRPAPTPLPEAELWMGTHSAAPSRVTRDGVLRALGDLIAVNPEGMLGAETAERFDMQLPYLMKLLAVAEPLSIQVHPNAVQATEGFKRETSAGIESENATRNYKDDRHKPELLCALTDFEALCGFRQPGEIVLLLEGLSVPDLDIYVQQFRTVWGTPAAVTAPGKIARDLLAANDPALAREVGVACASMAEENIAYATGAALSQRYPGDVGVVLSLFLNHIKLQYGQALYVPAGILHAYLHGTGIEVMANSDNVLRAGLTPKHVDIPEVARITRPEFMPPSVIDGVSDGDVTCWSTPAEEFILFRVETRREPIALPGAGPRVVFCLNGMAQLTAHAPSVVRSCDINAGQAAFVSTEDGDVEVRGEGIVFVSAPGIKHEPYRELPGRVSW